MDLDSSIPAHQARTRDWLRAVEVHQSLKNAKQKNGKLHTRTDSVLRLLVIGMLRKMSRPAEQR